MDDLLQEYINTGFTPQQINEMYQNLTSTFDLISRLTCCDSIIVIQAVEDSMLWLDGYLSYCKKEYN